MPVPKSFISGDSCEWRVSLKNYPTADGWELEYVLVNQDNDERIASVGEDDCFVVSVTAEQSEGWEEGTYTMFGIVSLGDQRKTISRREVVVYGDPTQGAVDMRTHSEIVLDAVKAMIEGKATQDQKAVTVDGHQLVRYDWDELERLRDKYTARVARERRERNRKGPGKVRMARTRMP